jgi:hypothetical protein
LILDRPGSSVATYTDSHFADSPATEGERNEPFDKMNQVAIEWTDVLNNWTTITTKFPTDATLKAQGLDPRTATYKLPWLHDLASVNRKLIYLYNDSIFDFRLKLQHLASTADRMVGDIITQSVAARGIAAQQFRLVARSKNMNNTFDDVLLEYNTGRYSNDASAGSSKIASTFPDVTSVPPDVTGFTAGSITEELFQAQVGTWLNRARFTFTAPAYPWLDAIELSMQTPSSSEWRYVKDCEPPPVLVNELMEVGTYSFKLVVRSKFLTRSVGVVVSKAIAGKTAPPSDVPYFVAQQQGDDVLALWGVAADIDLSGYEVRWLMISEVGVLTTAQQWAVAKTFDRLFTGNSATLKLPFGSVRLYVKAVDSGRRFSTNAKTYDIAVFSGETGTAEQTATLQYNAGLFSSDAYYPDPNIIFEGATTKSAYTLMLTRRFAPAAANAEITAGAYASIQAWMTAVELPRTKGVGHWAPLPAPVSGIAYAGGYRFGSSFRNRRYTARVTGQKRIGLDRPDADCKAFPSLYQGGGNPDLKGEIFETGINGALLQWGVELYSGDPFVQNAFVMSPGLFIAYTFITRRKPITPGIIDLVTDGSGNASYSFPVALPTSCIPHIDAQVVASGNVIAKVTARSETGFSVQSINSTTGAAVATQTVHCTFEDWGEGGSLGIASP